MKKRLASVSPASFLRGITPVVTLYFRTLPPIVMWCCVTIGFSSSFFSPFSTAFSEGFSAAFSAGFALSAEARSRRDSSSGWIMGRGIYLNSADPRKDSRLRRGEVLDVVQDAGRRDLDAGAGAGDHERLGPIAPRRERDEVPGAGEGADGRGRGHLGQPDADRSRGRRHDVAQDAPAGRGPRDSRPPRRVQGSQP